MEPIGSNMVERGAKSFERTFWEPKSDNPKEIERARRVQSCPTNIDIDYNYTLGLQQGLIENTFLQDMEHHGQRVVRPWAFKDFKIDQHPTHPVLVTLQKENSSEAKILRAKYLIGCDGGRSAVRSVMERDYGVEMKGDWVDTLWGAIDAVVETDFPDIRKIAAIHSKDYGSMYIFPREVNAAGKPVVRLYTQVNKMTGEKNKEAGFTYRDKITSDDIKNADMRIIHPYQLKFEEVEWWTAYPIGQRLASKYSIQDRVFIAGDSAHTHSPKAGQGMNTAVIDSHNLAWKLNLVERGLAKRSLLSTYEQERWAIGKQLIDFDAEYSALFSGEIPKSQPHLAKMSEKERGEYFIQVQRRNAAFTTGCGVIYKDNCLNVRDTTSLGANISSKLEAGNRLIPGKVTRFINSATVEIIHEVPFDAPGGFRIYICTGDLVKNCNKIGALAKHIQSESSFFNVFKANSGSFLPPEALNNGLMAVRKSPNPFFHILTIVNNNRFNFELKDLQRFTPLDEMLYADDQDLNGERIGDEDGSWHVGGIHKKWGLVNGGIVICRPDGYVGVVLPLDKPEAIDRYFATFLNRAGTRL